MSRADLLALSPESVAALANLGLVKRAQREIAAGDGPSIEEDANGVVTGRFKDGAETRLVPRKTLRETPCSCGAATICRHRVALALAYPAWHAATAAASAVAAPADTPSEPWSPSCFTDEALEAALGKRTMERARAIVRAGVVVEVSPGEIPAALLPTCAVRFHVPRDLAYARCDCALASSCEHVAVAAWAFREADARGAAGAARTVELSSAALPGSSSEARSGLDLAALDDALDLAAWIVSDGIAGLDPEIGPRFARVRERLSRAGFVWPATLVDDLELAVEAYRAQSARYRAGDVAALLASLGARARAVARGGELPVRYVLGADEARETLLDHVRLVSLGARVTADGRARDAEVYLADPDSGIVLVLAKRWTFGEGEDPDDGPALARRTIASRTSLGAIARGQLVSRAVRRRANRSLSFGPTRGGTTSVTPQNGAWDLFPPSVLAADVEALGRSLDAAPPRLLRPRVLAEAMRVIAVAEVGRVAYVPGEQQLVAEIADTQGHVVLLVRRYRSAAPHALEAIARALAGPERLTFVAGDVRHGPHGLEIDPVGLVTDRVVVPDLEPAEHASRTIEDGASPHRSPILAALDVAGSRIEEACHLGITHVRPEWASRTREAASKLDHAGLAAPARRLVALVERVLAIGDEAAPDRVKAAADAWMIAAIRLELAREAAVRS